MQGNILQAVHHVRLGRRIAEEYRSKVDSDFDSPFTAIRTGLAVGGIDTISSSFSRLTLSQENEADASQFADKFLSSEESSGFRSLDEAGSKLEDLIEARHQIQSQLLQLADQAVNTLCPEATQIDAPSRYCLIHSLSRYVDIEGHSNLQRRMADLMSAHNFWKRNFDELLRTYWVTSQTSILLQVWFFVSKFTLSNSRQVREMASDEFESDCIHTLDLIQQFFTNRREPFDTTLGPTTASKTWHRGEYDCRDMIPQAPTLVRFIHQL